MVSTIIINFNRVKTEYNDLRLSGTITMTIKKAERARKITGLSISKQECMVKKAKPYYVSAHYPNHK